MAVSKRARYEVMRRDNFTCRYCRSTENDLTVDHVMPVALGGTDDPSNLVSACKDCNAGKTSSSPDGSLVEDVKQDAIRHAEMIRQAYAVVVARMGERDEYVEEFFEVYQGNPGPADWRNTINRWFEMGVPIELVIDAAKIAMTRTTIDRSGMFAYLCGIVWNQVHVVNEAVELKSAIDGAFMTEEDRQTAAQGDWCMGWDSGYRKGQQDTFDSLAFKDAFHRILCDVVDKEAINRAPANPMYFAGPQIDLTEPAADRFVF